MKKLDVISNKIKSNSSNYFGRGHFENIIKGNKDKILEWFEDLMPIQEQIKNLNELGHEGIQKRNYVRIVTKLFPEEYNHFIAMNIILRDIDSITAVFKGIHDIRKQYDTLLEYSRLKFPGKHQKFVDFHTYQQFVSFYKEDLINRSINFEIDTTIEIEPNQQYIYNVHADLNKKKQEENDTKIEEKNIEENIQPIEQKAEDIENIGETIETQKDEDKNTNINIETPSETTKEVDKKAKQAKKEKTTNWVQVLLKGI